MARAGMLCARVACVACMLTVGVARGEGSGANIYEWKLLGEGAWQAPVNWRAVAPWDPADPAQLAPQADDTVYIYNGGTALVTAPNTACNFLTLGTNATWTSRGSGTLSVGSGASLYVPGRLVVGQTGTGRVQQEGTVYTSGLVIGNGGDNLYVTDNDGQDMYTAGGGHGWYTLTGGELSVCVGANGRIFIGTQATGILEQTGGSIAFNQLIMDVGSPRGWGIYTLTGGSLSGNAGVRVVGRIAQSGADMFVLASGDEQTGGALGVGFGGYGVYRYSGGTCEFYRFGLQVGSAKSGTDSQCYTWLTPGATGPRGYCTITGPARLDTIGIETSNQPRMSAALGVGGGESRGSQVSSHRIGDCSGPYAACGRQTMA